jgi:hypothetical protein
MLRPETEKLWNSIKDSQTLKNFILVGGTALSMRISHRLSEDLDFICLTPKLPNEQINAFLKFCNQHGFSVAPNDSPEAVAEWEDTGMDLADYQRDFIVNGLVKITFFAADDEVRPLLNPGDKNAVRVAEIHEVFSLKAVVSADRSKTRDWFDLYTLMKSHGFSSLDLYKVFLQNSRPQKFDIAIRRLTSGKPASNDEGYESLLENPPTAQEMSQFFKNVSNEVIEHLARVQPKNSPSAPK